MLYTSQNNAVKIALIVKGKVLHFLENSKGKQEMVYNLSFCFEDTSCDRSCTTLSSKVCIGLELKLVRN